MPSPRSNQNEYRQRNAAMDEADAASCNPSIDFSDAGCAGCSGVEVVVSRGARGRIRGVVLDGRRVQASAFASEAAESGGGRAALGPERGAGPIGLEPDGA